MKYAFLFFCSAILMSLLSCHSNSGSNTPLADSTMNTAKKQSKIVTSTALAKLTALENLLNKKDFTDNDQGQEIDMQYITPCVDAYPADMKKYGMDDTEHPNTMPAPANTRKYTLSENFNGGNLSDWLYNTIQKYDPDGQGNNMEIRIEAGIINDALITRYFPNDAGHRGKIGRIAFFLVPYVNKGGNLKRMDDPGDTGFELGGVQP